MEIGTTVCIYFFLQNHKILVLCSEVISYISNDWKRRCKKPKDKINRASISVKFHFGLKLNLRSALKNQHTVPGRQLLILLTLKSFSSLICFEFN